MGPAPLSRRVPPTNGVSLTKADQVSALDLDCSPHAHPFQTSVEIGDAERAAILGQIEDIRRFKDGSPLVAHAGINPAVLQTGEFHARSTRMCKRGSHYLRRAICQAAQGGARDDSALRPYYEPKSRAGNHHFGGVGAVANKLTHIIYAVLRDNKPYVPVARQIAS